MSQPILGRKLGMPLNITQAFASLAVPQEIKTDNGLAYISQKLHHFFQLWGITHSPMGQLIIERSPKSLEDLLGK